MITASRKLFMRRKSSHFTPLYFLTLKAKIRLKKCKCFSQIYLSCNHLATNVLQNLLSCIPKAALLHGKSVGFASQNSRFRNAKAQLSFFDKIIFTKQKKNLISDNTI